MRYFCRSSTPNQRTCSVCAHFNSHCICPKKQQQIDYDQWKYELHTKKLKPTPNIDAGQRCEAEALIPFTYPPSSIIYQQMQRNPKPMYVGAIKTSFKYPPVFAVPRPMPMCRDCFMVQQLTGMPSAICQQHWKFAPEIQTEIFQAYQRQWEAYHQENQLQLEMLEQWRKKIMK